MTVLNTANKIYAGNTLADAVYAGTNKVWPPVAAAPSWKLVTAYAASGDRQDFTGEVGMRIRMASSKTINWLGVRRALNNTSFTVKLYDWDTYTVLRTATIDLTGKTEGTFYYAAVAPITLGPAGKYYTLMVPVTLGGQWWAENSPVSVQSVVDQVFTVYDNSGVQTIVTPAYSYVGVDLGAD